MVSTVQVKLAAALWLPAASCAFTENCGCPQSGSGVGLGARAGTECRCHRAGRGSYAPFCDREAEAGAGLVRRVGRRRRDLGVGGAVVSTVQVKLAAALWLPAASCAFTENVWLALAQRPE